MTELAEEKVRKLHFLAHEYLLFVFHCGKISEFQDVVQTSLFITEVREQVCQLYVIPQAGDQRWVRTAGSALRLLHSLYGPFSKVYGIGRCSKVPQVQLASC